MVISGGGGTGATTLAQVTPNDHNGNGGHVRLIQITNPGSGYSSAPGVTLVAVGGHGSGAHAPNEYYVIESANPKIQGIGGAIRSHVDYLYELGSLS